jgi:hypothetical protein
MVLLSPCAVIAISPRLDDQIGIFDSIRFHSPQESQARPKVFSVFPISPQLLVTRIKYTLILGQKPNCFLFIRWR